MHRRPPLVLAAVLLALLALGAIRPAHAQEKLRVGILPFSESLGAVIADKQGFFKAEGLDVELTKVASGAQAVPVLQSGRLDIVLSNTITTLQAMEQGLDATILAPSAVARSQPPDTTTGVIVLKGTARTAKDLEGKRVAVNVINSTAWLYMVAMFEKHGADRSKIRFVEIPFPQMNDPLLNGQIDAIGQVEPFRTVIQGTGKVDVIGYTYVEVQPNADITQYIALSPWVHKNLPTAVKFARAVIKGSQFANGNEAATREINQQFTNLNPALKDKVLLPRFGTEVNGAEIRKTMDLAIKYGLMKQPVDLSKRILSVR
jgi:NitT/TauT family transport system substrate-binding protein